MNRYLFNEKTKIMARVRPDGMVTFHNEMGFQTDEPAGILTQEDAVTMLRDQGYVEKPI